MTDRCAHGLFGWPRVDTSADRRHGIEVVGVPSDFGHAYVSGTREGPSSIRQASAGLPLPRIRGYDHGDIEVFDGSDWVDIIERIRRSVSAIVDAGAFPLLLGGDHAVSHAAVAALERIGPLDIVWFDAHTDFCAWNDTDWHNHKQVLRRIAGLPHVERMLVVGHRGITYVDESKAWPTLDVVGCQRPVALPDAWLRGERPVYVSIDIDVLDPCAAPGTGHPVPGGLEVDTLCDLVRSLSHGRRLVGADLMEVNPLLDHADLTSLAAARILSVLVDAVARQSAGNHLTAPADA